MKQKNYLNSKVEKANVERYLTQQNMRSNNVITKLQGMRQIWINNCTRQARVQVGRNEYRISQICSFINVIFILIFNIEIITSN